MREKEDLTDKIVFLKLFLPKNFTRIDPLAYVLMLSLFAFLFGLLFFNYFWFLAVLGGFMLLVFGLFLYFWKWPLL